MAAEETTRKSHDDEKDAADVVIARETRTNDDDAQQINSSASSTHSFSSKLFLCAFIGLSLALGLREDVGELVKGSGIENETTRAMQQKEDAISAGLNTFVRFVRTIFGRDVDIVPTNYPPKPAMRVLTRLTSYAQIGMLGVTFRGSQFIRELFPAGTQIPDWVSSMETNKMHSMLTIHFLGNLLKQNFGNTGAFEIYYDGDVVFSKLKEKRMPRLEEIVDGIRERREERGFKYTKPKEMLPERMRMQGGGQ
ncbi:unnamed protein product [Bathycoccus prasinos]